MWTFGILLLAEIVASMPTKEPHTASDAPLQHASSSRHRHAAPQKGLGIDLNMPPPSEEYQPGLHSDTKIDLGGIASHDLPRREGRQAIDRGQIIVDHSIIPSSFSQKDKSIHQSSSDKNNGNGKRMRTLESLMQLAPISATQGNKKHRITPTQHAKGKAVRSSEASSASEKHVYPTSSSEDQPDKSLPFSFHAPPPSIIESFEQDSATSFNFNTEASKIFHPGTISTTTSKMARQSKNYIPGSRSHKEQMARKALFYKEWSKLNFHPNLHPKVMAERVFQMEEPSGWTKNSFGRFASKEMILQAGGKYVAEYNSYLKNIKASWYNQIKKVEETGELNGIDAETRRKILMQRALGRKAYGPRVAFVKKRPSQDAAYQKRLDEVEQAIKHHLAAKNIDFDQAPLNTVEMELRDMDQYKYGIDIGRGAFVNDIHRVLRKKKGAVDEDISRFMAARRADMNFAYNGLRLH